MTNRWAILALLFVVRTAMSFQFQSVGALGPLLGAERGLGIGKLGLLIGIYLAPGLALAIPGGAIGRRFGDRRVVLVGLALMVAGGILLVLGRSLPIQTASRLLSGTGGVLLNVLMSKMVTDWFAGREIATAMGIFVNSWPFGIALALLVLPPMATAEGLSAALGLAAAFPALGLLLFAALYPDRPNLPAATGPGTGGSLRGGTLGAVIVAGLIWGLYNAGIGTVFSFGAPLLVGRGASVSDAGATTSLALWLTALSVPLGGFLADRTGRPLAVLLAGLAGFAILLLVAPRAPSGLVAFAALGLVCGLSAGPIMSLPARVLEPATRAIGMGIFYTAFYLALVIGPWFAGFAAARSGTVATTFDLGAGMLVACAGGLALFERLARPAARNVSAA